MRRMDDSTVENVIGQLLRAGVLLAAFVVLVGGALYLRDSAHQPRDYYQFHGVPEQLKTITGVAHGTASFQALPIIQLGLLLLIATPVARVVFSVVAFGLERDWLYVALTLIVLGVLLFSVLQSG